MRAFHSPHVYVFFFQKDRLTKRKFNLDNRLRDDRGSHRDRDNRAGGERFDRNDNMNLNDDGPDGIQDDPGFDAYDGQGTHGGPQFSSEMAPPSVLMPVPGAGCVDERVFCLISSLSIIYTSLNFIYMQSIGSICSRPS